MATESFFTTYKVTVADAHRIAAALENPPEIRYPEDNAPDIRLVTDQKEISKLLGLAGKESGSCPKKVFSPSH